MKQFVVAAGMITVVGAHARGQNGSLRTGAPSTAVSAVLQRERDLWNALARGDTTALARMLADDVTTTSPDGAVYAKHDMLKDAGSNGNLTADATRLNARAYGNAAVVTGIITIRSKQSGDSSSLYLRITDTFVRRRNVWQLLASQQARVHTWQVREMADRELASATPVECTQEASLRSLNSDVTTFVKFTNASARPVVVHWLNYEGRRDPAAGQVMTLSPGRSDVRTTYVTHPWVATDTTGTCLAIYQPEPGPSHAIIR
ncbi:MAG TPA: DUF4440 domain-containing protein [Gemmatirosa sp.]